MIRSDREKAIEMVKRAERLPVSSSSSASFFMFTLLFASRSIFGRHKWRLEERSRFLFDSCSLSFSLNFLCFAADDDDGDQFDLRHQQSLPMCDLIYDRFKKPKGEREREREKSERKSLIPKLYSIFASCSFSTDDGVVIEWIQSSTSQVNS